MTTEKENIRPKRGWNNAAYEPKTHWRKRGADMPACGRLHSYYNTMRFAERAESVTCERCRRIAGAK